MVASSWVKADARFLHTVESWMSLAFRVPVEERYRYVFYPLLFTPEFFERKENVEAAFQRALAYPHRTKAEAIERHTPHAGIRRARVLGWGSLATVFVMFMVSSISSILHPEERWPGSLVLLGLVIGIGLLFLSFLQIGKSLYLKPSWWRTRLHEYEKQIPEAMLTQANNLRAGECPAARFAVDSLGPEHLLVAVHGDEKYVLNAWTDDPPL